MKRRTFLKSVLVATISLCNSKKQDVIKTAKEYAECTVDIALPESDSKCVLVFSVGNEQWDNHFVFEMPRDAGTIVGITAIKDFIYIATENGDEVGGICIERKIEFT